MESGQVPEHYLELIEMLEASSQMDKYVNVFHLIEADSEATLRAFKRCLTTGSDQARKETVRFIRATVETIKRVQASTSMNPDDSGLWYPHSVSNLLWVWNSLNVLDECGIEYVDEDNDILIATNLTEGIYPQIHRESLNAPVTDEHWRGLAALSLVRYRFDLTLDDANHVSSYIAWAGAHPDIVSAMDVTASRKTLNVGTLTGIIAQRGTVATSLTNGLL